MLKSSLSDLELVSVMDTWSVPRCALSKFKSYFLFILVGSSLDFPRFELWILLQILIFPSIFHHSGRELIGVDQVLGVLRGRLVIGFHPALQALPCQEAMLVPQTSG